MLHRRWSLPDKVLGVSGPDVLITSVTPNLVTFECSLVSFPLFYQCIYVCNLKAGKQLYQSKMIDKSILTLEDASCADEGAEDLK